MPYDPKEQIVDWSKVTAPQDKDPSPTMITSLNEGANLIGVETSSKHQELIGHEIFTNNTSKTKPKD